MKRLILGCGYLGHRVGLRWVESGDEVFAVTRSEHRFNPFVAEGFQPIRADVTRPETLGQLPVVDTVLFAVGRDRSINADVFDVYVQGLANTLNALSPKIQQVIYISSTGVYGDFEGRWVNEQSATEPRRDGGRACLQAEQTLLQSEFANRSTILRLAGIYGPGRVPTRSTVESGDWQKLTSSGFLNLIHVEDAAEIVKQFSDLAPAGGIFNVSDGHPVLRRDYYAKMAELLGIPEIPWQQTLVDPATARSGANKRVDNEKLQQQLEIEFQFPDYRAGLADAIARDHPS